MVDFAVFANFVFYIEKNYLLWNLSPPTVLIREHSNLTKASLWYLHTGYCFIGRLSHVGRHGGLCRFRQLCLLYYKRKLFALESISSHSFNHIVFQLWPKLLYGILTPATALLDDWPTWVAMVGFAVFVNSVFYIINKSEANSAWPYSVCYR